MLQGLRALSCQPASAWINTRYLRGSEFHLTVDEETFTEQSIYTFNQILSRYFRQHIHYNRYAQLIIKSTSAEQLLLRSAPAIGECALI
ncbi:type VI secretion system baseplate subunit TssF [Pseudoduganella sp. UC29_106]|uniref:type VI secretion system baseplate subunit TssF n=1 Tax=Pseudoduganella sp. UC29_106 TaxID=3374553 RepID=UPI0037566158